MSVEAHPVSHPGTTLGYRVSADGAALAFIPDHEPALGLQLDSLSSDWISGFPVADGANLLLHDSQYTEDGVPRTHRLGPLVDPPGRDVRRGDPSRADTALPSRPRPHG